jgi:putative sugar O-methyltransferase
MLGEAGWWIDGVLLNNDTATYQERLSLLYAAGTLDRLAAKSQLRILEIGGGYGALASALTTGLPGCEYWICDLPESLLFAGLYLTLTGGPGAQLHGAAPKPRPGINLLPNYFFQRLEGPFDLVINTLSMSEMSDYQVDEYGRAISSLIGTTGQFFEQNQDNRSIGLNYCKDHLDKHFARRTGIRVAFPVCNGAADIWEN